MTSKSPYRPSDDAAYPLSETATNDCVPCPCCEGDGQIATRQDYWGNWDSEQCRWCDGEGETTPERATDWHALLHEQDY